MARLVVMLPAYNEARALPALLDEIEKLRWLLKDDWAVEALVVDDGSKDGSGAVALTKHGELQLSLISHERNLGLGAALRSGINWFCEHSPETAVLAVLDADGTHPPTLIAEMLELMYPLAGEPACHVVIASRYAPGGAEHGLSRRRRFYSRMASMVLGRLAPIDNVRDYTCGFRLYEGSMLQSALAEHGQRLITENSFVCMAELLIKLAQHGARCRELGLDLHYELKSGPSKLNVPVTIWRYTLLGWRLLFAGRG